MGRSPNLYTGNLYELDHTPAGWLLRLINRGTTSTGTGGDGFSYGTGTITGTYTLGPMSLYGGAYNLNGAAVTATMYIGGTAFFSDITAESTIKFSVGTLQLPNGATASSLKLEPGQTANLVAANGASGLTIYVTDITPLAATTASIGGSSLASGACATASTAVAGAVLGQFVKTTPATATDPGAGWSLRSLVSAAGTVTTYLCNGTGAAATPAAATYNLSVGY